MGSLDVVKRGGRGGWEERSNYAKVISPTIRSGRITIGFVCFYVKSI